MDDLAGDFEVGFRIQMSNSKAVISNETLPGRGDIDSDVKPACGGQLETTKRSGDGVRINELLRLPDFNRMPGPVAALEVIFRFLAVKQANLTGQREELRVRFRFDSSVKLLGC